jgi:hypothetical protein
MKWAVGPNGNILYACLRRGFLQRDDRLLRLQLRRNPVLLDHRERGCGKTHTTNGQPRNGTARRGGLRPEIDTKSAPLRPNAWQSERSPSGARGEKAARRKSHPASAPAGSNRGNHGGDEMPKPVAGHIGGSGQTRRRRNLTVATWPAPAREVSQGQAADCSDEKVSSVGIIRNGWRAFIRDVLLLLASG